MTPPSADATPVVEDAAGNEEDPEAAYKEALAKFGTAQKAYEAKDLDAALELFGKDIETL